MQHKKTTLSLAATILLALSMPALADTTADVKALSEQSKYVDAYQLGRQHPEELGNPEFDFHYGIVSIEAGHASEGILALERYLLNFPDNTRARLELARGYFTLGEDARAREEFDAVSKLNPPAEVQAAIERHIDVIRAREGRYQTTASFYVEGGFGTDSNVNGGVTNANINLPGLGNVQVANTGVMTGDLFNHFAAGAQASTPLAPGVSLMGGVNYDSKLHLSNKAFDMESLGGFAGVSVHRDANLFRLTGIVNSLSVGSSRYRDLLGIAGEWFHQLDELQGISGFLQYAEMDYTGTNQVRNAYLNGIGAGYRKAFVSNWQPVFSTALNYSEEHNRQNRPDLGRDISGLNLGLNVSPHPQWGINLAYIYQDSQYNAPDIVMNTTRHDASQTLNLTATYLYSKNVSIRSELGVSENRSNLALYSYDRTIGSINLRYDFK